MKLNVDAAVGVNHGVVSYGVVVHNHEGLVMTATIVQEFFLMMLILLRQMPYNLTYSLLMESICLY